MNEEALLEYIGDNGPVLPNDVKNILRTDILFASAHLAELVSRKKLNISNLKVGGSPLYYLSGQEHMLIDHVKGEANRKLIDKLAKNIVLRQKRMTPDEISTLADLKDFAVPLRVTVDGETELFWRWHLADDETTKYAIKSILVPQSKDVEKNDLQTGIINSGANTGIKSGNDQKTVEYAAEPVLKDNESGISSQVQAVSGSPIQVVNVDGGEKEQAAQKLTQPTSQHIFGFPKDPLLETVNEYLQKHDARITECSVIRKGTELSLVVCVPSLFGKVQFFVKAKKKKLCNEKDMFNAFVEAEMKRLPLVFLYTGELNKKAMAVNKKEFRNMILHKL